ncbi:trihelix transcription factor ASR3-like [Fagus crenata]
MECPLLYSLSISMHELSAHLEAKNISCQLDRDQRKEHTDSLVVALSKVTDALVKIFDKL